MGRFVDNDVDSVGHLVLEPNLIRVPLNGLSTFGGKLCDHTAIQKAVTQPTEVFG